MKLLFLSDNFPPEVNAPATRTFEHCREWARSGIEVTVITCFPNFPEGKLFAGYKNRLFQKEDIEGIRVIRVFTYITANHGFYKRTVDYISFGLSAFLAGLFIRTDLIVATSPQFFAAVSGRWLSFFKRKPWVMEVRDLWPESIKTVGAMKDNFLIRYFEGLELRLYRSASHIITVTDSFKENLIRKGINQGSISVIKNGANLALYTPRPKNQQILTELGLTGKFIVGFIGTLGMAHKLDFIIAAASKIQDIGIHFLFIGAGAEKKNLEFLIEQNNPGNITLLGMIQKDRVPDYLSVVDVSLINLRKSETFKAVIPSKIFESSAMEKPILLGVDGESRQIIETYSAGIFFEPENESDFLEKLYLLKNDKALYERLKLGCKNLVKDFDRVNLAKDMADILNELSDNNK
jgi:glycosyltransferase involved in cell wall biosynthesis